MSPHADWRFDLCQIIKLGEGPHLAILLHQERFSVLLLPVSLRRLGAAAHWHLEAGWLVELPVTIVECGRDVRLQGYCMNFWVNMFMDFLPTWVPLALTLSSRKKMTAGTRLLKRRSNSSSSSASLAFWVMSPYFFILFFRFSSWKSKVTMSAWLQVS